MIVYYTNFLLTALISIGNNDRDESDASEGKLVPNRDEAVDNNNEIIAGDEDDYVTDEERIVANEDVMVNDGDVIDDNISISLLSIKGIYSDETSFLFQLSFNFKWFFIAKSLK